MDPWQETERGFQRQCVCTSLVSSPTLSFLSYLHFSTSFFPFSFRFYSLPYLSDARRTHSTREFAKVNAFFLPFPSRESQFIIPPMAPMLVQVPSTEAILYKNSRRGCVIPSWPKVKRNQSLGSDLSAKHSIHEL